MKMYYEKDADLKFLKGKTIAIIGYGSQGHAQAQNMRDSGVKVIVGELQGSKPWKEAEKAGFDVYTADEAAKRGDIIQILVQDNVQPTLFKSAILPHLKKGKALVFSHGFNIHYSQIVPPEDVDVYMVAPKSPGHILRRVFEEGKGVPCLIAVYQDYTGKTKKIALAHAKAIGGTRAGVIETTFAEETETDLLGEQAVLCGGVVALIKAGFETLVEAGYQPEIAYFECLNELKLIVDLIYEGGITWMRYSVSDTAQYGDLIAGPQLIDDRVKATMKRLLEDVQSGKFAKDWILENQAGRPFFNTQSAKDEQHLIEKVGRELRSMMSWVQTKEKK